MGDYECIIGLEIHAQLSTESKLFCGCANVFGDRPNTHTCPVCLGLPGALPVVNRKAVEYALKIILAVEGEVNKHSIFARKNYFYPDLPKGYQISQYEKPLGVGGRIRIEDEFERKFIGLERIHLEEDAGKSFHVDNGEGYTNIDLNRCGVPLLEIVTCPEIRSPHQAYLFLNRVRQIVQYLGICSGDMEKGALRCDANISIRIAGQTDFGIKVELKNMNSFRYVERALAFEFERQKALLEKEETVIQETRLWDEDENVSRPMRSKEETQDYRYFPEPDLPPLEIAGDWIERISSIQPELPAQKLDRFVDTYNLPAADAVILTSSRGLADYFELVAAESQNPRRSSGWILTEVLKALKDNGIEVDQLKIKAKQLGQLIKKIDDGSISGKIAKDIFAEMVISGGEVEEIIAGKGLVQISDKDAIGQVIREVIKENEDNVRLFQKGKTQLLAFFVGQVMAKTGGRANPQITNRLLKERLDGEKA